MRAKNEALEKILIDVQKQIQRSKESNMGANPTGIRQSTDFWIRVRDDATQATSRFTEL